MAFPTGWARRAPVTIQSVNEALTDFPVHLDASCFPAEALDTASGNKANSDGSDLRFSTTTAGTVELPFEVVRWVQDAVAGNRKATVHVKVPSLAVGATTTIYVWYGNSGATMPAVTDTNGRNAVWSSYAHVLHLNSTSAATNSTGATAWTYEGSPASTFEGPAGLMLDLDGTDDAVQGPSYNPSDHLVEFLVRADSTSDQIVVGRSLTGGAAHISESIWVSSSKPTAFIDTDGALTYGHSFADTTNASTSATELWQVRNRSTAGGAVVSRALPSQEQTHQAWASDGTYLYSIGGHQLTITTPVAYNQRYNPAADTWSSMTAIPVARWGMASVYLGGKIYCMGGTTDGTAASSRNDIYDVAGNSWSTGTALPAALTASVAQGQRACTDGTYIYVFANDKHERYDPIANTWSTMTAHPAPPNTWQSLICDGTYIYSVGGFDVPTNIRRYVIGTNTWDGTVYDVAPYGAWAMVCEPVGDGTWLIGFGRKGSQQEQSSALYRWNPSTKVWTQLNSFDMPTNATAAGIFSGKLYVYGAWVIGKAETYSFGHHACYNISTGLWETVPAVVEFARDGTWISGRILTSAPYAGSGKWYVGRQDGLTSLRSGAKIGELRISASARSKEWMRQTRATLMAASTFAVVGAADSPLASLTEAASATETQAAVSTRIADVTEAASATDAQTAARTQAASLTESATATETLAAALTAVATLTETASLADLQTAIATAVAAVSEALSLTETQTTSPVTAADLTETASLTDAQTAAAALVAALTESAVTSDAITAAALLVASLTETPSLTDSATAAAQLVALLTESATATDTVTGATPTVHTVSITELAAALDVVNAVIAGALTGDASWVFRVLQETRVMLVGQDPRVMYVPPEDDPSVVQ